MKISKYVESLSELEIYDIIDSYEAFEHDGYVGEKPIRLHAEKVMEHLGSANHITMWMNLLAFECYRSFAKTKITSLRGATHD